MTYKTFTTIFFLSLLIAACQNNTKHEKKDLNNNLTAKIIMQKAHERAGGSFWEKPKSLTLKGHAIFYRDGKPTVHQTHNMWRVFSRKKKDAHIANGKVRIESFRNNTPVFIVTYDSNNTYDLYGKQDKTEADTRWASNFGYGAIRHAFDDGYTLQLVEDDTIKNKVAYTVKVTDSNNGETFFGIEKSDFKIVKVAFQTPRGWHHREYSEFFSKKEYSWLQSGRVELFYNGKLSNEVFWDDFEVNEVLPDSLFTLK